ncbi:class I SAM-dependent methyltransferase [Gammaproteobacteria bacterium]|nr:class I SAM-dependent methyltransferase [Gammaproteobacteria bacterium]
MSNELLGSEADYFDTLIKNRTKHGIIPLTADKQNATFYEPLRESVYDENLHPHNELNDAKMTDVFAEPHNSKAIDYLVNCPEGNILDVCCGPGWLSLELARHGRNLKSFDISNSALEIAKQFLEHNKNSPNFGSIDYNLADISTVNLEELNLSGVVGYSAFHHLADPEEFLDRVYDVLPKDGIVVTFDDLESGRVEIFFRHLIKLLLPIYEYTLLEKLKFIFQIIMGKRKPNEMLESPMEIEADKHGDAAESIRNSLTKKFTPIYDKEFSAFSVFVCLSIKGPGWFRYPTARIINFLDKVLVKVGICKGSFRMIISKKP